MSERDKDDELSRIGVDAATTAMENGADDEELSRAAVEAMEEEIIRRHLVGEEDA